MRSGNHNLNKLIWLVFLGLFLFGCTPVYYAVFVNNTSEPLVVILLDEQEREILRHCVVPAGQTTKMELKFGVLRSFNVTGKVFASRKSPLIDSEGKYWEPGEKAIHILLTENGIHPIPKEYRVSWTNHIEEISRE